jgi:hypothetical protein
LDHGTRRQTEKRKEEAEEKDVVRTEPGNPFQLEMPCDGEDALSIGGCKTAIGAY